MRGQRTESTERVWLTYLGVEERTSLNRTTLWRAVRRGDLRVGGVGRAPRFHVDDVDEFMRRGYPGRRSVEAGAVSPKPFGRSESEAPGQEGGVPSGLTS